MKLVVVESPSKAKTINKYLGKEYKVVSSKGHMVDLPKSKIGVDVEKDFEPTYVVTKKKVLKDLKKEYKNADGLVLAADLDREGEAIAFHVAKELGAITKSGNTRKGHKVERIVFSEITKDAIQDAIEKPRTLNMDLYNAQQARRILDRLVGYKLSPILWKKIMFGLSAGRVQSVALRLIVERELERRAFKPDEYWSLEVVGSKDSGTAQVHIIKKDDDEDDSAKKKPKVAQKDILFSIEKDLKGKKLEIGTEKEAKKVLKDIENKKIEITEIKERKQKKNPKPPFITSTLQQVAVNSLGFASRRTMSAAQKLYEKGHITYMRTDSVNMSKQAVSATRNFVKGTYGEKYVSKKARVYKSKSKNAQEAHECIRPVDYGLDYKNEKGLTEDMKKIYQLILNRALASQMSAAEVKVTTIKGQVANKYEAKASGSQVVFDGYLKVMKGMSNDTFLPAVKEGDMYNQKEVFSTQHFTQPPARYSEASLIKTLEKLGIGRPSTYASIIHTIQSRKYVLKEGRYFEPTTTGEVVNNLLVKYFPDIVDYDFTAEMENDLDKVAEGKEDWLEMLTDFYFPFEKEVEKNTEKIPRDEFTVLGDAPKGMKCPECGKKMIKKLGRYGEFYSCSNFPDCKGMRDLDGKSEKDVEKEAETKEFKETYEPAPKTDDGKDYILKKGRYGEFWAHPDYPKVKDAQPLKFQRHKLKELYGKIPQTDDGKDYLLKQGRFGPFWAHPDYPKKKDIQKVEKKPDLKKEG